MDRLKVRVNPPVVFEGERTFSSLISLLNATREPPEMAQFDWFAISGYGAIYHD